MLYSRQVEDIQSRMALASRIGEALSSMPRGSQKVVAEACGTSPQAVANWRSSGRIDKKNLLILSKLSNFNFEYLLTGNGNKDQSPDPIQLTNQPADIGLEQHELLQAINYLLPEQIEDIMKLAEHNRKIMALKDKLGAMSANADNAAHERERANNRPVLEGLEALSNILDFEGEQRRHAERRKKNNSPPHYAERRRHKRRDNSG